MRRPRTDEASDGHEVPDLPTQLESLFDTVWWCERLWTLEERLDRQINWGKGAS